MIKDSNALEQAWREFMKCPPLEVLRNRQNKYQHRLIYVLLIISSDRRMLRLNSREQKKHHKSQHFKYFS